MKSNSSNSASADCVVLFSGGTDSTCAAAICAESHGRVHLITFEEAATRGSPLPLENVRRLRRYFGEEKFSHYLISTDRLVQKLSYDRYFTYLRKHHLFLIATPGFSSLSWHLRAIHFCRERGIRHVYDGMTKELMHLPGHMPGFRALVTELYQRHGIEFSSPVIDWDVPPDQRFLDRLIVDRHGFTLHRRPDSEVRTTGRYLFERGIFPHANVKGSDFDHRMQHDCYPFVVYNIFVFWVYLSVRSDIAFSQRIVSLFTDKIRDAGEWLLEAAEETQPAASLFESERTI
jgi:hypothetical protein